MSTPPRTQKFAAWINLMPGSDPKLYVTGQVETSASNKQPVLSPSSQPMPAQTLVLDLTIRDTGGGGTQKRKFRDVRYERPAGAGQFTSVSILWDGESLLTLPVDQAH